MAGQRPHQRTGLALGPQGRVDRPDRALGACGRSRPASGGRPAGSPTRAAAVSSAPSAGSKTKIDVDVGDVVELVAAALAHRDHGEPGGATRPRRPGPGPRRGRRRGCRPRGRTARRRRRRRPGGGRGRGRRAAAGPGGTPPAARRRASRVGAAWRPGARRRGRRRPRAAARRGRRTPPAGSSRAVGSVELAPLLGVPDQVVGQGDAHAEHRQQPHRGALVVGERGRAARRRRRRPRPAGPARPGPGRGRRSGRGSPAAGRPRRRAGRGCSSATLGVGEAEPDQAALAGGAPGSSRVRPTQLGEAGGQRPPRLVELGAGGVDLASTASWSMPVLEVVVAVAGGPRHAAPARSTSGCSWTPQAAGANRATWFSPAGVAASAVAPSGSSVTTSVFHWTPRRGVGERPDQLVVRRLGRPARCRTARPAGRRGFGSDRPPRATATSWWPRQTPRVGTPAVDGLPDPLLDRRRARGRWRRRWRPSTRRGRAARRTPSRSGSSSPAHGRQTRSSAPASVSQVPRWAGGQAGSCSTTRTTGRASTAPT